MMKDLGGKAMPGAGTMASDAPDNILRIETALAKASMDRLHVTARS